MYKSTDVLPANIIDRSYRKSLTKPSSALVSRAQMLALLALLV